MKFQIREPKFSGGIGKSFENIGIKSEENGNDARVLASLRSKVWDNSYILNPGWRLLAQPYPGLFSCRPSGPQDGNASEKLSLGLKQKCSRNLNGSAIAQLAGVAENKVVHEEGYPFFGGGLVLRFSAAKAGRAVGKAHEAAGAKGGDETFVFGVLQVLDSIFHGNSLKQPLGHRLS